MSDPLALGADARFPNTNQTKHCWQNYVDYHKCILAKGEDFAPCRQVSSFNTHLDDSDTWGRLNPLFLQFWLAYRSLCPTGWYQRWDEQRGMTAEDLL